MPSRRSSPRAGLRRAALAALALLGAVWLSGCVREKSYSFPEVRIDATLNQDGSLSIEERRTFDFRGDFSFAFFTVEHKQLNDVVEFQVSEGGDVYEEGAPEVPGHVRLEEGVLEGPGGFKFKATWWFSASDERRTWTIRYRVLCAADVYADTAHLLWKFVGEGWTVPTESAVITLHLPGRAVSPPPRPEFPCIPASLRAGGTVPPVPGLASEPLAQRDVRAWGHGPLHGEVDRIDPHTIRLSIRDLDPETFVEASVTLPAEAVPAQYQGVDARLDAILAEEARLAGEANAARLDARRVERARSVARTVGWALLGLFPVLTVLIVWRARVRERIPGIPHHLTEPPEEAIRPARLALEWSMYLRRLDTPNAFRAQVMEMARQGFVRIRPLGTATGAADYELAPAAEPPDDLDAKFLRALFPDDQPIRTRDFKPSTEQLNKLGVWWDAIFKAARGAGAARWRGAMVFLGIMPLLALFWAVPLAILSGLPGYYPVLALAVTIACPLIARRLLPVRYGPERAERMQRWAAFRRWLTTFSAFGDAPAAAIVIWERYLSLAVALGIADRVEKQVRAVVPHAQLRSPWAAAGLSATPPPSVSGVLSSLGRRSIARSSVFAAAASGGSSSSRLASSSSFSSGSGFSGGGFSGGGGGGGGGTGGGAG